MEGFSEQNILLILGKCELRCLPYGLGTGRDRSSQLYDLLVETEHDGPGLVTPHHTTPLGSPLVFVRLQAAGSCICMSHSVGQKRGETNY